MFNNVVGVSLVLVFCSSVAYGGELDADAVDAFVTEIAAEHDFDRQEVAKTLKQAKRSDRTLKAMRRPAEKAKPWYEYRKHFLTQKRINAGVKFWGLNAETLIEASKIYGVPAEIIVAIIGVETAYGEIVGSDRVVDALATLAFHYPNKNAKRMAYFRAQLKHLFLLGREQSLDVSSLSGSYAGAMGIPQFMPESYRKFAVDFNQDGVSNIWQDRVDSIGSVANYLKSHGWERDEAIVVAAVVNGVDVSSLLSRRLKPRRHISEYTSFGIRVEKTVDDVLAALFTLEGEANPEYWFALNNFYVIMRYNPRTKYAMAVVKLAEAIRDARLKSIS